jgi:hypothetical protein
MLFSMSSSSKSGGGRTFSRCEVQLEAAELSSSCSAGAALRAQGSGRALGAERLAEAALASMRGGGRAASSSDSLRASSASARATRAASALTRSSSSASCWEAARLRLRLGKETDSADSCVQVSLITFGTTSGELQLSAVGVASGSEGLVGVAHSSLAAPAPTEGKTRYFILHLVPNVWKKSHNVLNWKYFLQKKK